MKTLAIISVLLFSSLLLSAGNEGSGYVTIDGKTHFSVNVQTGLFRINFINDQGEKIRIPYKKVDSYMTRGHLFERLPVVCEDGKARCTALMQYITSRNGLRLYRYCRFNEECDPVRHIYRKAQPEYVFYVYKDGLFYLRIDRKNALTALPFFGVKVY